MDEVILGIDGTLLDRSGRIVDDPLPALGAQLTLAEGTSLRSVLLLFLARPELQRLSDFAPDLCARYGQWPAEGCHPPGITRLVFSRVVEIIGHPAPPRLEIYHTLRGELPGGEDMELKAWQVEALLDAPLVLGPLKHVVFGDRVDSFQFATVCNLFDFLEGVLWQLAFHGAPLECALRR